MLPGAALLSLAARFCWQGQHFRLWTPLRLVSAGRGSTSGSGRYPSAFRGPPLDAARRSTWEPRGWFLLARAALQALDGTRARFGAPPLMQPRGSFLLAGAALPRARFGPPPSMLPSAALGSLAARFCWQGQHFRLWTVPERVSGPLAARRSTWEPRGSFLLAGAALQALDGTRARFGAPPPLMLPGAALGLAPPFLDAARRRTWEPRGSFLLAGAALQALDGTRARFPPLDAAKRST